MNRFNGDAELLDDLVSIRSSLVSVPSLIVVCRTTIGRLNTIRSLFSFDDEFFAYSTLPGRAQSVHRTTPKIRPEPTNPHFLFMW